MRALPKTPLASLRRLTFVSAWLIALGNLVLLGCSRTQFRRAADRESYGLINSRQSAPLWEIPARAVEPKPLSRMYVAAEQDCGPRPLDDPAAKRYMDAPNCIDNRKYYSQIPIKTGTENPIWVDYLPRDSDGQIKLTQPLANDLALIHSREYQTQFESVYLTALQLSGNRFEFATQWNGGLGADFSATGSDFGDGRNLDTTLNRLGFTRSLAGGGQFATELLNSLTWDFGSGGIQQGSAALVSTFTQPLLRGAFRHVRLENLTQAERNLLYDVRDFARFRRLFYVDISSSYLNLLGQRQSIRNSMANVQNLRQNLTEYDFYVQLRTATQIQRDQVFQQYQNGRLSLLAAEQNFATSLDNYRFALGLPAWVPLDIDESLLQQFDLANDELVVLQDESQELFVSLMQYLPPEPAPRDTLLDRSRELNDFRNRLAAVLPEVQQELLQWLERLDAVDSDTLGVDDQLDFDQQVALAERIEAQLAELVVILDKRESTYQDLHDLINNLYDKALSEADVMEADGTLPEPQTRSGPEPSQETSALDIDLEDLLAREKVDPKVQAWQAVQDAVGNGLRSEVVELYLIQTQIRLYLIDIDSIPAIDSEAAISFAFQNRLDLMNRKAGVVDAFRKVEVAADALESDLSISGTAALGSDPSKNNPYRFDSSANRYSASVQFDGPLNRLNERNAYRASQIVYQRSSRDYMSGKDQTANEIRLILRQLELNRLNFQIARQQVVAATRQVDETQINLRSGANSESVTLFLLQALQGILDAKNNLINNWIAYRVQKMRLFAALEVLYLDENGQWLNEDMDLEQLLQAERIDAEYFPETRPIQASAEQIEASMGSQEANGGDGTGESGREFEAAAAEELLPEALAPSVPNNFQFGQ